ncbi:hypothetical protein SteCoe_2018 [Stentor coeruleus]|uniref:cGMP-dependent protein kinase n=1 Tax=Stentor coeruleus TaxID=5963 RepID=A0A1R2D0B8_9CILI|nr:hypothetical protein SteCoe_2018 [Stentor coeruleus]
MGAKCLGRSKDSETIMLSSTEKDFESNKNTEEMKELIFLTNEELNDSAKKFIFKALKSNHLFKEITTEDIGLLYKTLQMCVVEAKKFIFQQGQPGSLFFIINSGMVEIQVDGHKREVLTKESCFGETSLLGDSNRKSSAMALSKCSFWVLGRQKFMEVLKKILSRNYDKIRKVISKASFFSSLAENYKDLLAKVSILHRYNDGETIIYEGDDGNLLFILNFGTIVFMRNSQELIRISNEGVVFGESCLLTGFKRTASCVSYGTSEILSIDQKSLQKIFGNGYKDILLKTIAKHSILTDPHLSLLSKNSIVTISDSMKWVNFSNGSLVLSRNYTKNMLKIVCVGNIISNGPSKIKLPAYQVIGFNNKNERALKSEDYTAGGNTIIGELENTEVEKIIGIKSENLFEYLETLKFMKKTSIFKQFSLESIRKICEGMSKAKYKKQSMIFDIGSLSDSIMIVKSGIVEIVKDNKPLRLIGKYDSFGERTMREKHRSASAFTNGGCELFVISKDLLLDLPDNRYLKSELDRKKYYQKELKYEDLEVVSKLSEMEPGRQRYCAKNLLDDYVYEIIIIPKYRLNDYDECMKLVREKEILLQLDHSLIVKMVSSGKADRFVYFIREYIKGATLNSIIPSAEEYSKIITLYLSSVLEYLHEKGIVYREINPDNIIIGKNGLPYLYNFKNAKVITERTQTKVGNPFYMAPEMIQGKNYTKNIDYWSLGVVLYEMIYGILPFNINSEDQPLAICDKIVNGNLTFPQNTFESANQVISKLLTTSKERIDSEGIKRHSWMSNIEWEKLINMDVANDEFPKINTEIVRMNTGATTEISILFKVNVI